MITSDLPAEAMLNLFIMVVFASVLCSLCFATVIWFLLVLQKMPEISERARDNYLGRVAPARSTAPVR